MIVLRIKNDLEWKKDGFLLALQTINVSREVVHVREMKLTKGNLNPALQNQVIGGRVQVLQVVDQGEMVEVREVDQDLGIEEIGVLRGNIRKVNIKNEIEARVDLEIDIVIMKRIQNKVSPQIYIFNIKLSGSS